MSSVTKHKEEKTKVMRRTKQEVLHRNQYFGMVKESLVII